MSAYTMNRFAPPTDWYGNFAGPFQRSRIQAAQAIDDEAASRFETVHLLHTSANALTVAHREFAAHLRSGIIPAMGRNVVEWVVLSAVSALFAAMFGIQLSRVGLDGAALFLAAASLASSLAMALILLLDARKHPARARESLVDLGGNVWGLGDEILYVHRPGCGVRVVRLDALAEVHVRTEGDWNEVWLMDRLGREVAALPFPEMEGGEDVVSILRRRIRGRG